MEAVMKYLIGYSDEEKILLPKTRRHMQKYW